ncbi:hypothetical protein BJ878DRAFT_158213 [Calycina marina]|uniref:Attractin/MKLN-like beta-propeller domain-containing protein n=1 Tax=Calycina marina TaxID=1763456 RepID=A0A9P7Z083_9HELO|nr:hypothetical protein BJ878DRAFT_158213 [Calycina marina]
MADSSRASSDKDKSKLALRTKNTTIRSQKIIQLSPSETSRPQDIPEDSELPREHAPRSHTPGHLPSKSQDKRKKASDLALRQRSQSLKDAQSPSSSRSASSSIPQSSHGNGHSTPKTQENKLPNIPLTASPSSLVSSNPTAPRPLNLRSTSAIASKPLGGTSPVPQRNITPIQRQTPLKKSFVAFPPLPDAKTAPDVKPAPASGMYWSKAPLSGTPPHSLRAHITTLIGSSIYIFGGCSSLACFNELYVLDADAFYFSTPYVCGDIPVPLRAMTCTAVGKKMIVFGGGDGPAYYNDVYILDTVNFRWTKPVVLGDGRAGDRYPSRRRAHTACLYRNGIYVFGGGDGVRALNDVWRLDVADTNKLSWKLISPPASPSIEDKTKPKARGYHTANMVGSKLIIFGGSDGGECFRDVWIFDAATSLFSPVSIPPAASYPRLSHTATIVGSYLFVIGGHDGVDYCHEVLLLNLVTMVWDKRHVYGSKMESRGYHGTVLHDSRLVVVGGFDGGTVFGDVWILELAVHAYYSQISHFSIDV